MNMLYAKTVLHLACPRVGNEVRKLVRELARLAGVRRVVSSTKIPRLLTISYDPHVTQARTLVQYVKRGWPGAQLV